MNIAFPGRGLHGIVLAGTVMSINAASLLLAHRSVLPLLRMQCM